MLAGRVRPAGTGRNGCGAVRGGSSPRPDAPCPGPSASGVASSVSAPGPRPAVVGPLGRGPGAQDRVRRAPGRRRAVTAVSQNSHRLRRACPGSGTLNPQSRTMRWPVAISYLDVTSRGGGLPEPQAVHSRASAAASTVSVLTREKIASYAETLAV